MTKQQIREAVIKAWQQTPFPYNPDLSQSIIKEIWKVIIKDRISIVYDIETKTHWFECSFHNTKSESISKNEFISDPWKCPDCQKELNENT